MPRELPWSAGVIEGFYGPPWSRQERLTLFEWMERFGLRTYFYAPKDDPHHRSIWRQPLPAAAAADLGGLIADCGRRGIDIVWAIHPGLDIGYASADDLRLLMARLEQVAALGCRSFAVLFDDIPGALAPADARMFASLAAAQAHVANRVHDLLAARVPGSRLMICPTPYCTRMANAGLGGPGYLAALGSALAPAVDVLWTGPEIISREITREHLASVTRLLARAPVIWDNLFADDYDGGRFFVGPYAGRPVDVRDATRGLLVNPNNELPLNFVPLHTLGQFMALDDGDDWDPRRAYLRAIRDWLPAFELLGDGGRTDVSLDDLVLLGDCFYLPYDHGETARRLLDDAAALVRTPPAEWGSVATSGCDTVARLKALCNRLADLRDRPLLHALARRVWALREELTLLEHRVGNTRRRAAGLEPLPDDDHRPGTFRGGFVADMQAILPPTSPRPPVLRPARDADRAATARVCLETGDHGADGTPFYTDDPDALARIYVWPYLALEPGLAFVLEDDEGVCGYVLAAADSRRFYARYEAEWRPRLAAEFPEPEGDPAGWTRAQRVHRSYHRPDYHCPEPYAAYPAHAHIDLLPRVQGKGQGGPMMRHVLAALAAQGVPGVHLGVSGRNTRALGFYRRLGFTELERAGGPGDECVYLGLRLEPLAAADRGIPT